MRLENDGIGPDKDLEARFMEVTLLELSQFMPGHLQKLVEDVVDQPLGAGLKDWAIFKMASPSSAAARTAERRRRRKKKKSRLRIFYFFLVL